MIRKRTVFVLGAGASAAYGFPSGAKLADEICRRMSTAKHPFTNQLRAMFGDQAIETFPREFLRSGQSTLDAFVERRHEFQPLVRVAIVQNLIGYENEGALLTPANGPDWYKYLLKQTITTRAEDFSANLLKVITFNFDRSFERRLFLGLMSSYSGPSVPVSTLAASVPVLHLHGDLGAPSWLRGTDPELARDYGSEQELQLDDDRLRLFAERIRLISDPILDERINTARTWMREAEVVCFLGFGYHHINLRRLDVRSLEGIVVRGTAMDIAPGEMTAIMREFSHRPNLELFADGRADILQFLRATTIVHD